MNTEISGREFDTILAALNEWKGTGYRLTTRSARIFLHRNGLPLRPTEIEDLMDKLQGKVEEEEPEEVGISAVAE